MVRTRIAPSPTGHDLHIGNLYTALINWVWVRKNKGRFVLRIEDTDRKRYVPGAEKRIINTLKTFGLTPDEGPSFGGDFAPYRQSQRLEIYKKYAKELVDKGFAYYCFCTPERLKKLREAQRAQGKMPRYDRYCLHHFSRQEAEEKVKRGEPHVIRLLIPRNSRIEFTDLIRGKISFDSNLLDDQVLLKSDGYPTYHLAVVVDDHLMKITHVIRAEEWISSTPKHILLYKAFGWKPPIYAHLPILRNPDRSKLSKRKNPVWASWYLEEGYLPEALLNYLALMGWSHPEEKEIFDLKEFINVFDLKDVAPVGPIFDITKLTWMNSVYIKNTEDIKLAEKIFKFYNSRYPHELVKKTVPLIKTRIKTLKEYDHYCNFFLKAPNSYQKNLKQYNLILEKMIERYEKIKNWRADIITSVSEEIVEEEKISTGKFFMILRVAITGNKITPPISESMEILGKEESLKRLKKALNFFQK